MIILSTIPSVSRFQGRRIADLAKDYDLSIKDYKEEATILLGMSTTVERTTDDGKLYTVYEEFANEGTFLTASAFEFLTGQKTEVAPEHTKQFPMRTRPTPTGSPPAQIKSST